MMKRILIWTLSVLFSLSLALGASALAEDSALQGQGTASDPWLINSADDWASFADEVAAGRSTGKYYRLNASVTTDGWLARRRIPFRGPLTAMVKR